VPLAGDVNERAKGGNEARQRTVARPTEPIVTSRLGAVATTISDRFKNRDAALGAADMGFKHRAAAYALLAGLLPSVVAAQDADTTGGDITSQVTVTAPVTRRVPPDRATLYLVVDAPAPIPLEAARRSQATAATVADTLRRIGGRAVTITVTGYGAGPTSQMERTSADASSASAYLGRTVIRAEVERIDLVAPLVTAAFSHGATGLGALRFENSNVDSVRSAAIAEGFTRLRDDAELAARANGQELGRLMFSHANRGYDQSQQAFQLTAGAQYPSNQAWLTPPDVTFTVNVTGTYQLKTPDP
jgi:uncharacterized protein YggE